MFWLILLIVVAALCALVLFLVAPAAVFPTKHKMGLDILPAAE